MASATKRGEGKVCLLTGATAGLGKVAAFKLAEEGFHLFLACRNEAKTLPVGRAFLHQPKALMMGLIPTSHVQTTTCPPPTPRVPPAPRPMSLFHVPPTALPNPPHVPVPSPAHHPR